MAVDLSKPGYAVEKSHKFDESVEQMVISQLVQGELTTAKTNQRADEAEFQSEVDLLDSVRTEKDYEWNSDIRIPEFVSQMHTQSAIDAGQYFTARDFVECFIQDPSQEALDSAAASKELINRTLNQRHLHHYQKFMRARNLTNLTGRCYIQCFWEKETRKIIKTRRKVVKLDVDIFGRKMTDPVNQIPATRTQEESYDVEEPYIDRWNYDVIDPRNVFMDNEYVYSLQDKKYFWVRTEKSLYDLMDDAERMGYFNLEILQGMKPPAETDTSRETYNKEKPQEQPAKPVNPNFDIYTRYGKYWCRVTKRNALNEPLEGEPGIDPATMLPYKDAEFIEMIQSYAEGNGMTVMIRFQPTPFRDVDRNTYRPVIRGLCYIHPTNDGGVGDGKHSRELQIAIDDTFNIAQDRVMLATLPTLKKKKYQDDDNASLFFAPDHVMEVTNIEDVKEFKIEDDVEGALRQIAMLVGKMQQLNALAPPALSQVPEDSSTTATAVAGAQAGTNSRTNYKSLTFENTALTEMYWMINQMSYAFASRETLEKLMGEKFYDFRPGLDYWYKAVSQAIESEFSKQNKVKSWSNVLGLVAPMQHPDTPNAVNYILKKIFEYLGDEFVNFQENLLNPNKPYLGTGSASAGPSGGGPSNQAGLPQSTTEQATREAANV